MWRVQEGVPSESLVLQVHVKVAPEFNERPICYTYTNATTLLVHLPLL